MNIKKSVLLSNLALLSLCIGIQAGESAYSFYDLPKEASSLKSAKTFHKDDQLIKQHNSDKSRIDEQKFRLNKKLVNDEIKKIENYRRMILESYKDHNFDAKELDKNSTYKDYECMINDLKDLLSGIKPTTAKGEVNELICEINDRYFPLDAD